MSPTTNLIVVALYATICASKVIYHSPGHSTIGLLIEECDDNLTLTKKTIAHLGVWTVQRLNDLSHPSTDNEVGLTIHQVCTEEEYLRSVFDIWYDNTGKQLLGIIIDYRCSLPNVMRQFSDVLNVPLVLGTPYHEDILSAGVKVLEGLGWLDDIEVVAPDQNILKEFYRMTRRDWMCVNRFHMHEYILPLKGRQPNTHHAFCFRNFVYDENETTGANHPIVFLGSSKEISINLHKLYNVTTQNETTNKILLIPFDGEQINNLKDDVLVMQPTMAELDEPLELGKIIPSTLLFEIAAPIIQMTKCLRNDISCNDVTPTQRHHLTMKQIMQQLKLESLESEFHIEIIHKQNETLFHYTPFDENLTAIGDEQRVIKQRNISASTCFKEFDRCLLECENFKSFEVTSYFTYTFPYAVNLRPEPWVYAFISLSLLGIIFCLTIMAFIISRLCKKQVLEGNPILTIFLLIDVIVMFASVGVFAIEGNKSTRYEIHILRALCITLPYTFAFALLLSRTILLATVSKEVGFMSHVAGSVQGFLTLFIFAVQCALSLQLTNNCQETSILSLMTYNAVLLILLVFITPMITKSQRNYREGKYFTIAIILLACTWSCWLPAYGVLDEVWKDPLLCLGLVSTGSIILGTIFIPRTYLMTVSAARERFTSALPSLATATSAMDIYRASTQPVYDCVNVAAIAAANLRAQHEQERRHQQRADFYAAPNDNDAEEADDEEDEFVVQTCDSPPIDKVTRF